MTRYTIENAQTMDAARKAFAQNMAAGEMMAASGPAVLSASRLYAYASGQLSYPQADIEQGLSGNLTLRRTYKGMIEKISAFQLPEAIAASDDGLPSREGDGCRIHMKPSAAEPGQVYVIVELTRDRHAAPKTLVVCDADDNCYYLNLPEARNGIAQAIVDRGSDVFKMLADPKSTAYLR